MQARDALLIPIQNQATPFDVQDADPAVNSEIAMPSGQAIIFR